MKQNPRTFDGKMLLPKFNSGNFPLIAATRWKPLYKLNLIETEGILSLPGSEIVGKEINAEQTWKKIARDLGRERVRRLVLSLVLSRVCPLAPRLRTD